MPSCLIRSCLLLPATGNAGLLDKEASVIPRRILFNLMTITHYCMDWYQDMRLVSCPSFGSLHCLVTQWTGKEAGGGMLSRLHFILIVLSRSRWSNNMQSNIQFHLPPQWQLADLSEPNSLLSKIDKTDVWGITVCIVYHTDYLRLVAYIAN